MRILMDNSHTVLPLSPLRKAIAQRMTEAIRTIPHFRLVAELEVDELLVARAELNSRSVGDKVSVNDCVIKACASTLVEHPAVNCQIVGGEIHQYRDADISVVVAVEGGLSTP